MIPNYEKGSNLFRILFPNSLTFPPHLHTSIELLLVEDGEISVTIGSCTQVLKSGDFAIIFPNCIHSYYTDKEATSNRITVALCPVELGGDFMPMLLKQYPVNPFISSDQLHPDISYVMKAISGLRNTKEDLIIIKAYLQLILARTLPLITLKSNKDKQPPQRMAQLISYLAEHFCEPLSLELLASQFGLSRYVVSRIFSEKLNTSFTNYINTLRINYAQTLLQGTDQDILSISMNCGYENSRTFNREFKKICGTSPREYRKSSSNKNE
jgi:AraC-like DNA-binding protein